VSVDAVPATCRVQRTRTRCRSSRPRQRHGRIEERVRAVGVRGGPGGRRARSAGCARARCRTPALPRAPPSSPLPPLRRGTITLRRTRTPSIARSTSQSETRLARRTAQATIDHAPRAPPRAPAALRARTAASAHLITITPPSRHTFTSLNHLAASHARTHPRATAAASARLACPLWRAREWKTGNQRLGRGAPCLCLARRVGAV
jgi:hypothetical protein